jgi:hypothetical protein
MKTQKKCPRCKEFNYRTYYCKWCKMHIHVFKEVCSGFRERTRGEIVSEVGEVHAKRLEDAEMELIQRYNRRCKENEY